MAPDDGTVAHPGGRAAAGGAAPDAYPFITSELRTVPEGSYALVTLAREPVNSMDLAFWRALAAHVAAAEADPQVRGVVFRSGLAKDVFTAGNDLAELYAPRTTRERYTEFWVAQNECLARLYRSPLATVSAIRGACPAGGCCLSLCCDYRVMTEQGHIGLNEVAIGISVPEKWGLLMERTVGMRAADRLLQGAILLSPQEALKVGMVDELVPRAELEAAAERAMRRALALPDGGRVRTKEVIRGVFSREWEAFPRQEAAGAWAMLEAPGTVKAMGATLARLAGKKGKAKL